MLLYILDGCSRNASSAREFSLAQTFIYSELPQGMITRLSSERLMRSASLKALEFHFNRLNFWGLQSTRSSLGSTSSAPASLRSVPGCGRLAFPCSIFKMVAGLTFASRARSRCESSRSLRSSFSFSPSGCIAASIVPTSVDSHRSIALVESIATLGYLSIRLLQGCGESCTM